MVTREDWSSGSSEASPTRRSQRRAMLSDDTNAWRPGEERWWPNYATDHVVGMEKQHVCTEHVQTSAWGNRRRRREWRAEAVVSPAADVSEDVPYAMPFVSVPKNQRSRSPKPASAHVKPLSHHGSFPGGGNCAKIKTCKLITRWDCSTKTALCLIIFV